MIKRYLVVEMSIGLLDGADLGDTELLKTQVGCLLGDAVSEHPVIKAVEDGVFVSLYLESVDDEEDEEVEDYEDDEF